MKSKLKDFKQLLQDRSTFPKAFIYKNIDSMNIDLEFLAINKPYLYDKFISIFDEKMTKTHLNLWNNYLQGYTELEKDGFLNIKNTRKDEMEKRILSLKKMLDGPCLVPLIEIEEIITEKKQRNKTSIEVPFNEFISLIEKYYNFDYRDFFNSFRNQDKEFQTILNLNEQEYKNESNKSPANSLISTKICILSDMHRNLNGMPYADFWHYLLDTDFANISNGSTRYLFNNEFAFAVPDKYLKKQFDPIIFTYIRNIIFKEISQLPFYNGTIPDEIQFYIFW